MNKALLLAAVAGMFSATVTVSAQAAEDATKEKCYGIAKAGKNDCKAADGSHSCAGLATKDDSKNDWSYVAKGKCVEMKGSLTPEKK